MAGSGAFTVNELSPSTWKDFEALFAKHNGVWGGCWCMYYHSQGTFLLGSRIRASRNKQDKHALVRKGKSHGIICYYNGTPVGWCQYGTREELPRLDASRTYLRLGLQNSRKKNFGVSRAFLSTATIRGKGAASFALKAALSAIRKQGGGIIEAYPLETLAEVPRKTDKGKASFMWSGSVAMFQKAGFKVVARLGKSRRLVRRTVY